MLKLTTNRRTLDFEIDGKPCSIPAELDMAETKAMGDAYVKAGEEDGASEFDKGVVMIEWFVSFASKHVPEVSGLSFEALSTLMKAWNEARSSAAGATEGE